MGKRLQPCSFEHTIRTWLTDKEKQTWHFILVKNLVKCLPRCLRIVHANKHIGNQEFYLGSLSWYKALANEKTIITSMNCS
jgi:hypothetical protein